MGTISISDFYKSPSTDSYNIKGNKFAQKSDGNNSVFNFSSRSKVQQSEQKYAKSVVPLSNTYKDIRFKKADTVEAAKTFALEKFGIEEFDVGNIDVANWLNEGFTNISNESKGKAEFPEKVSYARLGSSGKIAEMTVQSDELRINKDCFDSIDFWMKDRFNWLQAQGSIEKKGEKLIYHQKPVLGTDDKKNNEVFREFLKVSNNPKEFSPIDKLNVINKMDNVISKANAPYDNPEYYIETLSKQYKFTGKIKQKAELYSTLNKNARITLAKYMLEAANKYEKSHGNSGHLLKAGLKNESIHSVLYHELGHLSHKNKVSMESFLEYKDVYPTSRGKSNITEFKTNIAKQRTASLVSDYAKSSPVEFVAETFAAMCGRNSSDPPIPKEVVELYKEYGGPQIFY